jgi:hypothetical protein
MRSMVTTGRIVPCPVSSAGNGRGIQDAAAGCVRVPGPSYAEIAESVLQAGIELAELDQPVSCADCDRPAVGLRSNLDREPSCLECEAERLAMIVILLRAAVDDDPAVQIGLFDG